MLTAAVALPLLILLILKGSFFLFSCFVLLLCFLGLAEFFRMALPERKPEGTAASLLGALLPIAFIANDPLRLLFAVTAHALRPDDREHFRGERHPYVAGSRVGRICGGAKLERCNREQRARDQP